MSKILSFFNNLTSIQKSLAVSIVAIILFVSSASLTYSLFAKSKTGFVTTSVVTSLPGVSPEITEDPSQPRTEACPLNGSMHTKQAKDVWDKRRPLAVMIENHTEARPQSGLSSADVVYETVAEGGITRFMGVFLCNYGDVQVGPVRSARTYFLDWLSEYNALYAHVGGANTPGPADALGQIIRYDILDLNQFSIGFPTFWRDYQRLGRSVATEHTMYSTTDKLWAVGLKRGWTNLDENKASWDKNFISWKFKDDPTTKGTTAKIDVNFWQSYSDYAVSWQYDSTSNSYKRSNGGASHTDLNNKKQISAKNVVVQFERESNANDGYENNAHLLYKTIGSGKVLIFQDGQVVEGTWNKKSRLTRSQYLDKNGKEIIFTRGPIWIQTVPEGAKVSY